jgi:hypothetical protein
VSLGSLEDEIRREHREQTGEEEEEEEAEGGEEGEGESSVDTRSSQRDWESVTDDSGTSASNSGKKEPSVDSQVIQARFYAFTQ